MTDIITDGLSGSDGLDRRAQRSRAALVAAFVSLVLQRRYDAISVGEIADAAGVGRSTFYDHFRNKDDLLREGLKQPFAILAGMVDGGDPAREHEVVEHFWENRRVGNVLFAGATRQILTQALCAAFERRLALSRRAPPDLPVGLAAAWLAAAQVGLLAEWLTGHTPCSSAVIVGALRRLTVTGLSRGGQ